MLVTRLRLRDFRGYAAAEVRLGPGADGRARAQRRRQDEPAGGAVLRLHRPLVPHVQRARARALRRRRRRASRSTDAMSRRPRTRSRVGFQPGEPKRMRVDGAPVERLIDVGARPLVSVFLPDRLELVKGPPALRRAHLDQVVAALWPRGPARAARYSQALAQRNALLGRIRAGRAVARVAAGLGRRGGPPRHRAARRPRGCGGAAWPSRSALLAGELGLAGEATLRYRPRTHGAGRGGARRASWRSASRAIWSAASPATARTATTCVLARDGRELRAYGSQGEQRHGPARAAAGRARVLADERGAPPLLLLDDVMSELDGGRAGAARRAARIARPGARDHDRPRSRPGRRRPERHAPARWSTAR